MFQMINDNAASRWSEPSVCLSTVSMPRLACIDYAYESCLFGEGDSEVVKRYATLTEAIAGHTRLAAQYNLNRRVK